MFVFFKQNTAYEMLISDCSSDLCSSYLASSGLGRHFALTLAKAGAAVAVGGRRADKLAELVDEITATGGTAVAVNLDVGQRASVIAALDEASDKLGPLDLIVNNAGVTATRRVLDYTDDDWSTVMKTNLDGSWLDRKSTRLNSSH